MTTSYIRACIFNLPQIETHSRNKIALPIKMEQNQTKIMVR